MSEVGGIRTENFKEIELEAALRRTIQDPDKTLRLLVKLCKRVESLEERVEELEEDLTYTQKLTGAI